MFLPLSVDSYFHHLNEFIFIFFLTEFLLYCLFKKKFLFSFYFYLDIVAIASLIPQVGFIWNAILVVLNSNGKNSSTVDAITSNSHLAKASRASTAGSR